MACITCGKSFSTDFKDIVRKKLEIYKKTGQQYYVYKEQDIFKITKREYFPILYSKGTITEFYRIDEFKID